MMQKDDQLWIHCNLLFALEFHTKREIKTYFQIEGKKFPVNVVLSQI